MDTPDCPFTIPLYMMTRLATPEQFLQFSGNIGAKDSDTVTGDCRDINYKCCPRIDRGKGGTILT